MGIMVYPILNKTILLGTCSGILIEDPKQKVAILQQVMAMREILEIVQRRVSEMYVEYVTA